MCLKWVLCRLITSKPPINDELDARINGVAQVIVRSFVRMTISLEVAIHQISFEHRVVNIG